MRFLRLVAILVTALLVGACAGSAPAGTDGNASAAGSTGVLRVLTPSSGAVVAAASVTFAGTAPSGAIVVQDISFGSDRQVVATDGTWTLDVELQEGANDIKLRLGDDDSTAQTIRLTYQPTTAVVSAVPTAVATPDPTPDPTASPKPTATPKPTPKPTPVEYKKLSDRSWRLVVKSPDDYIGRAYQLWACIFQFDAATGSDSFLGQAANKRLEYWWSDGDNASFVGQTSKLADFVEDDIVVLNVIVVGSYTYDTQAGGSTTVPAFSIKKITRKGDCS